MKYPNYPAYGDSGIEWIGEAPKHWETTKIRFLARPGDKTFTDGDWIESPYITDVGIRLIQTGNIGIGEYKEQGFRFISEESFDELNCTEVLPGDVLICRLADPVGRACLAPEAPYMQITSVDVCILKTKHDVDERFVVYFLSSKAYLGFVSSVSRGGTRERISRSFLGSIGFLLPSTLEQSKIANFLDAETAQIDTLIAKQERLIALLQEKRQALISHAVTKGLNPDAPMVDSGVEWLGEIPAHWEVKRLKHIAYVQTGVAKGRNLSGKDTIEVPYLRVANVQDGYLDLDDVATIEIGRTELERYALKTGDVLMNEGGDNDKLGRGCVWHGEIDPCIHQNHVFAVRPFGVDSEWLNLVTGTDYAKFYFFSFSKQSTNLASLSSSNLRELPVVCPPPDEQQSIREHVHNNVTQIDVLIDKANQAVERLNERRTALISAAVTGKIDVRSYTNGSPP